MRGLLSLSGLVLLLVTIVNASKVKSLCKNDITETNEKGLGCIFWECWFDWMCWCFNPNDKGVCIHNKCHCKPKHVPTTTPVSPTPSEAPTSLNTVPPSAIIIGKGDMCICYCYDDGKTKKPIKPTKPPRPTKPTTTRRPKTTTVKPTPLPISPVDPCHTFDLGCGAGFTPAL